MATPDKASNWLAKGAVNPTAAMRLMNARRDRPPVRTRSIRPRKCCSFMGCLPSDVDAKPQSPLLLCCKMRASSIGTGQTAAVNGSERRKMAIDVADWLRGLGLEQYTK